MNRVLILFPDNKIFFLLSRPVSAAKKFIENSSGLKLKKLKERADGILYYIKCKSENEIGNIIYKISEASYNR